MHFHSLEKPLIYLNTLASFPGSYCTKKNNIGQKAGEELGDEANTHTLLHMLGAGTSVVLSIQVSYAAYQLSTSPLLQVKNVWWEVLKPDS